MYDVFTKGIYLFCGLALGVILTSQLDGTSHHGFMVSFLALEVACLAAAELVRETKPPITP